MATLEQIPRVPVEELSRWLTEPFRIFFPMAVLFGWVGVGHWLSYSVGVTATYSCKLHGLIQMQAFMMAFATGFLLTAVPRRTQTSPATPIEISVLTAAFILTVAGAMAERWLLSEAAYAAIFLLLGQFAMRRFLGRAAGRRPPAAFVLVPIAALQGLAGAALLGVAEFQSSSLWTEGLGRLMIEQGVFLCLVIGIGALVLPLMGGAPPPPDLGSSPRETRKAFAYGAAGMTIVASLILEQAGFNRVGPLLRAAVVTLGLGLGGGAWRPPAKSGVHRQLVWLSTWLMPVGLIASGVWPDYRVPALHVLFIGGFALMAFGVATHVALSHLNLERLSSGWPPAVVVLGTAMIAAMLVRVAADASGAYFVQLGWAAAIWIAGSAAWLAFMGPRLMRRSSTRGF